jgi:hypothetical protein
MTEAPTVEQEPTYTQVTADTTPRLDQLHAAYAAAKAANDEAAEQLKVITDAIKSELQSAAPDSQRIALNGPSGPTLLLTYTESWRVDAKKLKREDPETYVRFATKGGSWRLVASKGGASE